MDQKIIFRDLLGQIQELAKEQGGRLRLDEVDEFFKNAQLNKDQMKLVYDYLRERHIRLEDDREDEDQADPERTRALEVYLEEIGALPDLDPEEELLLMRQAAEGVKEAQHRLAQAYLPLVCDMAGEYEDSVLPAEDLIQEGNIALLLALQELTCDSLAACQARLINAVNTGMMRALQEAEADRTRSQNMVSKVSSLEETIRKLEDELGHTVSAQELSAYLDISLEEILDTLNLAGDGGNGQ